MTTTQPVQDHRKLMQEQDPSLADYFHILLFHRRLLFCSAFFMIAVGLIMVLQLTPRYTASSSIMIGVPKTKVVDIEQVLSAGLGNDTAINSELEVLRSRELAKKLVVKFNLINREEFNPSLRPPGLMSRINLRQWIPDSLKESLGMEPPAQLSKEEQERRQMATAIRIFLEKLKVSPIRLSKVIRISFESNDPKLAAAIANELPEAYIIGQMEAKLNATEKATKWLNEQLTELKEKVAYSERAVEIYRDEYGLTEVQNTGIISSQLSEVNSQLMIAKAERAQAEARLKQVRQLRKKRGSVIESASEVLASSLIQRLREQEAQVTRKASELSVEYGPKHPKILQVNAEIEDIRAKINLEIRKIITGLQNEVEVARSKERSLSESLQELEQRTGVQKKESIQLNALEREAAANRTLFETFLNRFKETSTTTGMEEADARVISKAEIPSGASFPNRKRMFILVVIVSFSAAIGLTFLVYALNPGLLSPEQIENELGLPTIGMIPLVRNKNPHDYVLTKPHSNFGEALNSLKIALILSGPDEAVKAIQITSSVPGEGKTTLAIAFARLLAKSGKKVVLLDGDLRRATLGNKFQIAATCKGLTDLLMSTNKNIAEYGFKDDETEVFIIPKGQAEYVNASDVFSSNRMQVLVASLKRNFDYIIIDTPPLMAVSDARIIAQLVDKTVFVIKWDKTPLKVIRAAIQQLQNGRAHLAGCVLQQVNLKRYGSYGDSGYYYRYGRYKNYYDN
jgi:capsular exopolysaccharide synthesis family protein